MTEQDRKQVMKALHVFASRMYYSDDAVNLTGEYQGLWVRWKRIDEELKTLREVIDNMEGDYE